MKNRSKINVIHIYKNYTVKTQKTPKFLADYGEVGNWTPLKSDSSQNTLGSDLWEL